MKHICLDKLFLIFLLIVIFTGSFNSFFPYFFLLFIHELGHAFIGIVLGYKLDKITFYPYGGITSFNMPLNTPIKHELIILVAGPLMQIIGYCLLKPFYPYISVYHYVLLTFNLLPIYPLDGGKIMHLLCCYFWNYLKSIKICCWISLIVLIGLFCYNIKYFNLNMLLMIIFLFFKLKDFYFKRHYFYNRFLLERYLYSFSFPKLKYIHNIQSFYRDTKHFINYQKEDKVLKKIFTKIK